MASSPAKPIVLITGAGGNIGRSLASALADAYTIIGFDKPGEKAESYYQIRVRTKYSTPTAGPSMVRILPGMVATVDIRTGKNTVLHYLLKPIIKTKEMALRER